MVFKRAFEKCHVHVESGDLSLDASRFIRTFNKTIDAVLPRQVNIYLRMVNSKRKRVSISFLRRFYRSSPPEEDLAGSLKTTAINASRFILLTSITYRWTNAPGRRIVRVRGTLVALCASSRVVSNASLTFLRSSKRVE